MGGWVDAIVISQPLEIVKPDPPMNAALEIRAANTSDLETLRMGVLKYLMNHHEVIFFSHQREVVSDDKN